MLGTVKSLTSGFHLERSQEGSSWKLGENMSTGCSTSPDRALYSTFLRTHNAKAMLTLSH